MERNTQQRQAILQVLEKAHRPLSVQEILESAKLCCVSLGIATVYRNIKVLLSEGKLISVDMPGGVVLYELPNLAHHHHFSCVGCLKVFDINVCGLNFQSLVPSGFQLQAHEILLSGFCNSCASSAR